ncbi:MAG: glutamyl-tRNA reductase [Deltaproteobacteria bacterium]|nr:glutamyl-tRNA reductase [Deltaproteobacteria bacterium]
MEIVLIGLSHKTAPIEVREKFCLPRGGVKEFLGRMAGIPGVREGLVLSTCNRTDVLTVMDCSEDGVSRIKELLAGIAGMSADQLSPYLYVRKDEEAVKHIFRVASSLDSMVLGEPQILGQVKEAYSQAVESKFSGLILNKLFHRSFFVAKRVRTETKIATQAVSVSYAAVELAKKILGDLDNKRAMLIGAGEMSELAARHLISQGVGEILVTNRTHSRAIELAQEFKGKAVPFEDFPKELKNVDIILSSTGSAHYIIRREQLTEVIRARKNRPMFFIDIAVPRDIDPKINEIDNVYVYDIDDLEGIVESNKEERKKEVQKAEEIVFQGVEAFNRWLKSLEVVPTILALRNRLEEIRQKEVEKTLSLLKNVSDEERKALDFLTNSIINKILHHPISLLKHQESRDHGKLYVEMTRKIFHLDEGEDEQGAS